MEIKRTNVLFSSLALDNYRDGVGKKLVLIIMRTFIFLFCTIVFSLSPNNILSQNSIKVEADKTLTVDEVFALITDQTDYSFIYQSDLFKDAPKVSLKKGVIRVDKLINQSLSNSNLNVILTTNNAILIKEASSIQQRQVSGKITDEAGLPLAGVTVQVKGTTRGVATDFDGTYTITVADNANVLMFSSVGYATQEITVGNQTIINVALKEEISKLDEVTINAGYYNVSERERTGSIAKIEAKTIEKQPVNNPLAAMQGHLTGVNIVQTTGVPGGGFTIEIRGKNFINGGTEPLYIIDGVPYGSESLESDFVGREIIFGGNSPLNAINPADISNIEVLKDADATAIYGSRGANGVVLITTKKGKIGKTKVSLNVSSTLGKVTRFLDVLNTEQYLEIRREAAINDGFESFLDNPAFDFFWPDLKTWDQDRYTDWQDVLIGGTAYRNNAQVSVSGGNEQTQFLFSGTYLNETTVFPGDSNYNKGSGRLNINHHSSENRFNINVSANYTVEDNQLPLADFSGIAKTIEPNAPELYDNEGNLNWENSTWSNPLAALEREYQAKINTFFSNIVVSYQLLPGLGIKTNLGYNNYQLDSYNTSPSTLSDPALGLDSSNSRVNTNTANRQSWIVEPQLNWQKQWKDTKLDVLLGTTFQKQVAKQFVQRGIGFPSNNLILNLSAAESLQVLDDSDSEYNYQAFFGRINFNFNSRYIFNITGRRDGSSRFGPNSQFGNFGAIGAAWLFSNESFLNESPVLSFGKIRGSYGTTGSDNIGDYQFLSTYSTTGLSYDGTVALEPTGLLNPNFAWEENKKLEVALELGFFKDRLQLNTSWYQNRSTNQLIGIPLPTTTGFTSLTDNFNATVENTGFEIDFRSVNIQRSDFEWTTTFNLSVPRNELIDFPELETSTFANRYRIGEPLTAIPVYNSLGVDPDTGLYTFEDFNGDDSITAADDKQLFEDLAPKYFGGLGNTLNYKKLHLNFFFQFKKQQAYNPLLSNATAGFRFNGPTRFENRWQEPGDMADIQRASLGFFPGAFQAGENQTASNAAISDASFIRLRNITLSYTLPDKLNFGMEAQLYIQGQNLLTISKYEGADPEQPFNSVLPPLRQITCGVQLTF